MPAKMMPIEARSVRLLFQQPEASRTCKNGLVYYGKIALAAVGLGGGYEQERRQDVSAGHSNFQRVRVRNR
jgi:hypothetical protein